MKITMLSTSFAIFTTVTCLLFAANSAHGHGYGFESIPNVDVDGRSLSILVEMPAYFEDEKDRITITAVNEDKEGNAENVTFLIGLFHKGDMIFRTYFFTENGVLPIVVTPTSDDEITIHGEQTPLLEAWYGTESDPVEITGPLFDSGGLYNFEIEVRTIDEPTNIIEDSAVYNADLSLVETVSFIEQDAENHNVEFRSKSYFDTIHDFEYDPQSKRVTFEMPFDWREKQLSHVPVVHIETHFPKDFVEFLSPSYTAHVNGIKLFKASVSIDDYTEDDERVIHFVMLQDDLRFMKNEMKKSVETLPDSMKFELSTSEESAFPLEAYTKSEDFKVNLSWDPLVVEPDVETNFVFTIRDGRTNEPLRNSDYTFVIIQNGDEIHRMTGTAQIGGEFEKFRFGEDQTGPTTIKFENIRNTGQETEFTLVVVPEFGSIAMLVLIISITGIIFATRRNLMTG